MTQRIAVFLDTDNIRFSSLRFVDCEPDYQGLLTQVAAQGDVVKAQAYINPDQHHERTLNALESAGFNIIYTPTKLKGDVQISKADVYLTIDAMEALYEQNIDLFWLCTGDGDFSHLVARLIHKHKKKVVVYAVEGSISHSLTSFPKELVTLITVPGKKARNGSGK